MNEQTIETKDLTREQKLLAIKAGYTINFNKSWLYAKSASGKTEIIVPKEANNTWVRLWKRNNVTPKYMVLTPDEKVYFNIYAIKETKDQHHTKFASVANL